jgi:dethiobiotin synthetase
MTRTAIWPKNNNNQQMNIIIAGIHTGIGKTLCSAIMTEALEYDYWKPVQAGDLHSTDCMFVQKHIGNTRTKVHDERYRLAVAASPHWAAELEDVTIDFEELTLPSTEKGLIIETAGGVMSPLNATQTNLDLIRHLDLPVALVCNDYLGSINHSLLSIEALRKAEVQIMGLVFCGKEVKSTRDYILSYTGLPMLFSIPHFETLDEIILCSFAASISSSLKKHIHEFCPKR